MLILLMSLFLESLWNPAKLGMGVTQYLQLRKKITFCLSIEKFALALLSWNFKVSASWKKEKEKETDPM